VGHVWRLQRSVYPALDGEGARRFGGRWNRPGRPVVYTSEHLALCVLELLVHLDTDLVPDDFAAYDLEVPDDCAVETVSEEELPTSWRRSATCSTCRNLGDAWVDRTQAALLEVPSAVLTHGRNLLINPHHPDAKRVRLVHQEPFAFDPRLFK
jgi:RES domain-containing protein